MDQLNIQVSGGRFKARRVELEHTRYVAFNYFTDTVVKIETC